MTKLSKIPKVVAIIGVGSLGGFVANELSLTNGIEKLTLIDFDIVCSDNLSNSIYEENDIGKSKTTSLYNKLLLRNKKIDFITDQYINGNIKFSDYDMVIDCRDLTSIEDHNISCKTYISGSNLIIDCKSHTEKNKNIYDGKYLYELEKWVIMSAACKIKELIISGYMDLMIKQKLIISFDLDSTKNIVCNELKMRCDENKEVIEDYSLLHDKIRNITEISNHIIRKNKDKEICFKSPENNFEKLIAPNSIQQVSDLIPILQPVCLNLFSKNIYLIKNKFEEGDNKNCITYEIICEGGGA